jgi:MFS family permease
MSLVAAAPGKEIDVTGRLPWLPAAAVLFASGWGSNQFTPMLLVYRHSLGVGATTVEGLFGFYALGLAPGLLWGGPLSDRRGRRAVAIPAACASFLGTLTLIGGAHHVALLFAGRLLIGLGTGAALAAGTAWVRETSRPPFGSADEQGAARRAALAMTTGFALGPLVAGVLAEWAGAPTVIPYVPHAMLMLAVLVLLARAVEMHAPDRGRAADHVRFGLRNRRFWTVVAPMAPWVFAAPAVAFALLPTVVGADRVTDGVALTAAITTLCALAGIGVQPVARRLDGAANRAAPAGLLVLSAGLVLAAATVRLGYIWLLVPSSIVLGSAYGLSLTAGLVEVQRLAAPAALARATAIYYVLSYVGFAAPFIFALAAPAAGYATVLAIAAALALATAAHVARSLRVRAAAA